MTDRNIDKGRWGEDQAADFLTRAGYHIRCRNWRAGKGEIDIIAEIKDSLVFVEVKMGQTEKFGPPELRVTKSKQRQLYRIAQLYLQEHENSLDHIEVTQFDVIVVDGHKDKFDLRHYKNAFML